MSWIKKETESKLSWMHSLYILSKLLKETQNSNAAAPASSVLLFLALVLKSHPSLSGNVLMTMIGNRTTIGNNAQDDTSAETDCNNSVGLKVLIDQHCVHMDERSVIDFRSMINAAFHVGASPSEQQAQYQALSLLCTVFQIPQSIKMNLLERNLSNFNEDLAQFIMHDVNVICELRAHCPEAFLTENGELSELVERLRSRMLTETGSESCTVNVGGYEMPCKPHHIMTGSNRPSILNSVDTPTSAYNLRSLAQAVLTERPIIVQGSSGSGKSYIIRSLAVAMGLDADIIELHINDQTDSKTLIGSYVCSDVPGEFIWQAGVLTQAVLSGRWVVIENLDHVPLEFVAAIAPLLARRRIYLPHRDGEVPAHPNFRLFGTRTLPIPQLVAQLTAESSAAGEQASSVLVPPWQLSDFSAKDSDITRVRQAAAMVDYNTLIYMPTLQHFSHLFHYVCVHDLNIDEVQRILITQHPTILPEIITKLLDVYLYINGEKTYGSGKAKTGASRMQKFGSGKKFGLREMLKAAGRIQANCGEFNHASGFVTDLQKRISLQEVVDVFAGSIRTVPAYEEVVQVLGGIWGIAETEVSAFFLHSGADVDAFFSQPAGAGDSSAIGATRNTIQRGDGLVKIGRATISTHPSTGKANAIGEAEQQSHMREQNFAMTKYSLRLLERVAVCVSRNEPVLLVGETGTGKTTSVQELADILGKRLTVQNLSLSTDVSDLLGGYRPVTMKQLFLPMYEIFVRLFNDTLSSSQNTEFLQIVARFYQAQSWKRLLKAFLKAADQATKKLSKSLSAEKSKHGDANSLVSLQSAIDQWASFRAKIARYEANLPKIEFGFAFQFVDGLLVDALRNGDWVLLDEINLASSETLQGLSGVLDSEAALFLTEKGSGELVPVVRHPDFRVFAAMNPPTDIGKKELPASLLGRFTELYTEELVDPIDLRAVVERYLAGINTTAVADIVSVYLGCRAAAEDHMTDSTGQRPRYSLRSLTRSLQAAKSFLAIGIRPFSKALFEAFLLNFQTMLSETSRGFMHTYLRQSLYSEGNNKELAFPPSRPGGKATTANDWVLVKPFWLRAGPLTPVDWAERDDQGMTRFVLTKTVESNIRSLAAAVGAQVAPILIQGPTSIGKTSMVEYLAARCGFKCVRINNHEHTDVQEYIGGYVTNSSGQLEFKDGLLVEALRKGHWIILDELNLAPSDVLEALNRLLDDNKELLIPETGELVKPAFGFTLFATQNPPGIYGGRKPLSRAFKNRFLELSVCDLPLAEVEQIVTQSCGIPPKFSAMLVKTMQELQIHRQKSTLFQGKYGSITTRDLIKWGRRRPNSALEVAQEGYMLIAEKLRSAEEKQLVADILSKVCKAELVPAELYLEPAAPAEVKKSDKGSSAASVEDKYVLTQVQSAVRSGAVAVDGMSNIAVTATMRRMWELVNRALKQNEPVLLIGETGCGKTTVCQLYAAYKNQKIRILNCHQSTETADLIGGLRPIRGREAVKTAVLHDVHFLVRALADQLGLTAHPETYTAQETASSDKRESPTAAVTSSTAYPSIRQVYQAIGDATEVTAELQAVDEALLKAALDEMTDALQRLNEEDGTASPLKKLKRDGGKPNKQADPAKARFAEVSVVLERALLNWQRCRSLFEWQDGPLITAMKDGDVFVIDEINLAEDAVIERLNSVLESGRSITLAEKGGMSSELIVAHPNFKLLATMNPGGDFGKRELSPALRSRFTEVWIPNATDPADIALIVKEILSFHTAGHGSTNASAVVQSAIDDSLSNHVAYSMIEFMEWMNVQCSQWMLNGIQISVREILAWAKFINQSSPKCAHDVYMAYIHGAFMIMLDGLGIGMSVPREKIRRLKHDCLVHLVQQCAGESSQVVVDSSEFFLSSAPSQVSEFAADGAVSAMASVITVKKTDFDFSVGKFSIPLGPLFQGVGGALTQSVQQKEYVLDARITTLNLGRILRAMQLPRAILLEGPPGVGKSSLIANLAALTGHTLVRINLSEHSELSDLLGTDLPAAAVTETTSLPDRTASSIALDAVEGEIAAVSLGADGTGEKAEGAKASGRSGTGNAPNFKWCDGVFLTAMKQGHWVLLDELNLAPQSVLEGLNACFDHRQEVFLPDIGQTVTCPPSFRVFCAQNPMVEGGGRKGLPQSFLSRFSRVFVEAMTEDDLLEIVSSAFNAPQSAGALESPLEAALEAAAEIEACMDIEEEAALTTEIRELAAVPAELKAYIAPMVRFTQCLQNSIVENGAYGHTGGPWEFNLRDIFRWCELVILLLNKRDAGATMEVRNNVVSAAAYVLFVRRMRTAEDREKLCADFSSVFGFPLIVDDCPAIETPSTERSTVLNIGAATLPVLLSPHYLHRNLPMCDAISGLWRADNAPTMQAFSKTLETLMHCISLQWPVLLVGAHGSGKHRVMQYLATQTGHVVDHFAVSPSTDSTELLGSFEQVSASRHLHLGVSFLQQACVVVLRVVLHTANAADVEGTEHLRDLCATATAQFQQVYEDSLLVSENNSLHLDEGKKLLADIQGLVDRLWEFANSPVLTTVASVVELGFDDLRTVINSALLEIRTAVKYSTGGEGSSGFEWVDGIIVKAVLQGKWLVIDNINLCSASVLDRLNSLLEPNGTLLLTECGDGRIITPHKDFRIFFCMDPSLGEISRAMRNRCVEVALLPTDSDNKWSVSRMLVEQEELSPDIQLALHDLCVGLAYSPSSAGSTAVITKGLKVKNSHATLSPHFPKYQLFSRVVQLLTLNVQNGALQKDALITAIDTVLPGFVAKATLHTFGHVDNVSVTEVASSTLGHYKRRIREAFNQAYVSQDIYMALDMLSELSEGKQLTNWMYQIISQAERRSSLSYCPLAEYIRSIKAALAPPTAIADGEDSVTVPAGFILNLDVQQQTVLVLNLLVALTFSASTTGAERNWQQKLVTSLLQDLDLQEQYAFWLAKCSRYYNLTADRAESATATTEFSVARWNLVQTVQFQRVLVLEQERLSAEAIAGVRDPIVLQNRSSTQAHLSVFSVALGIRKDLIVIDSRELSIINALYQVVNMIDQLVDKMLQNDAAVRDANTTGAEYETLLANVRHVLLKRDALCLALCTAKYFESGSAQQNQQLLPWDEISICTRWLKKYVKQLGASYLPAENAGAAMRDTCAVTESELSRFDRAVCAYWHRPVMTEKLRLWKEGGHAAVPAQPLNWKLLFELRDIVNLLRDDESSASFTDTSIRKLAPLAGYQGKKAFSMQKEWLFLYSTFYWACTNEESVDGHQVSVNGVHPQRKKNVNIASLMAGLKDKFLEYQTATVLPDLLVLNDTECFDYDDGSGGGMGLQYTEYVHNRIQRERNAACEQSLCAMVEPVVIRNLLYISNQLSKVLLASTGRGSKLLLALGDASAAAAKSDKGYSVAEWAALRDLAVHTVDLTLRYTGFHPSQLRELQSLAWAIDAYLASIKSTAANAAALIDAKLTVLLQLARVFAVTLETRIFAFAATSTANHLQSVMFDFSSQTLGVFLDVNSNNTGSSTGGSSRQTDQPSLLVPWEYSLAAGFVRLVQPVTAEIASRHLDIQTVSARYQNGGSALKLLNYNTATATISSCKIARKRLYQLVRATVAAANRTSATAAQPESSNSLADIQRLDLLKLYVQNVLLSCRDFYDASLFAAIRDAFADTATAFDTLAALNIFARIENPAISSLFSTCLQPVLSFIAGVDKSASLDAIGAAWVQVGLLRMHLLLPTMPVDPAAKSAIKSRLLQEQNAQLHQSVCTSFVHHSLADATLITQDMVTSLDTLDSRQIAIERLNGRGIQRPDSSVPFVEVYFEIKSALEGIVSVERVHNLLNSISECLKAVTDAGSSTRTNTSAFNNLKSVLPEELAWQATAQTFVQRLEQNYSAYEDIVSAIVSAVSNISHGMRLVAGSIHQTCASATRENATASAVSGDDASTSAYVSVMQFPFSVSVPLSNSSSLSTVKTTLLEPVSLLLAGLDAVCDKVTEALTICKTSDAGDSILSKRMPDPRSIAVVVPHIVLLHALSRIEYLVSGSTMDLSEVYSVFQNTLDKFVEAYLKELDEKRRKAAAKEALFRNREKVFESDDLKEEEAAFKEHFPDHLAAFKSLNLSGPPEGTADTVKMALEDDEDQPAPADVAAADEEEAEEERMMVDDNATTEVVSHHVRMVFFELVKHCAELHLTYRVAPTESQRGADATTVSVLINQKHKLQQSLITATLITSKALDWALRGVISPNLDAQLRGTSLMGLAAMAHKCVFTEVSYQSPFDRILNTVAGKKPSIKRSKLAPDSPDRDLLLLLNDQTDDTAPEWKPLDFHKNANPQESYKATEILQNIFDRSSELLVQFPGNELLLQVCKVSAKISEFHLTTPIGKMLISLQLLLQKAEEWEMFAAKHVSLRAQMAELSGLIAEWRELELKSWETLLRSKEVEYARTATLNWYTLMRMLNGQPIVIADAVPAGESVKTEPTFAWPGLDVYAPQWLKTGYRSALATALSVEETAASVVDGPKEVVMAPKLRKRCPEMFSVATEQTMTESQYLAKIFTTLDGFMRSSVVGEYPTRLHLVRLFALQLQLECKVTLATGSTTSAPGLSKKSKRKSAKANSSVDMAQLKERLANIVTGIWQYYDQFLPSLRKFQDTLKAPIQTRLKGEVKIGKWDQLNTYALIEYSEKIHRKLNKFLREYQGDVLDHPFSAILRRELLDDFVTKSGELQSATEVPPVGSMCPALFPLGDGISGTNPQLLLQTPISNSDYFAAEKPAMSAVVVLDAAEELQVKFPRIFKADTYASRMRKYLTELLIPEKVEMSLAPAQKPAPVPVKPQVVSEDGDDSTAMVESKEDTETDVEFVRNDYFNAQIFNKKACYGLQGALLAEDLCQEIFSRVESLRSEDVAKPIKQRAVRDMLTTLKDHGISHLRSTVSVELRQNLQLFSTNAPLSCETMSDLHYAAGNPKHMFNKAELYYSKAISEVTQLRAQSTAAISNDISNRDASTMVALSENMLSAEVKLRASIGAALGDYKSLLSTLDSLNSCVSMNSNSSTGAVVPTASHAELAGAARINQTVAHVMLDNLIQLHSLLQSAADSNATNNIEEDYVIPVVPASVGRKAIQVIANVISLIAGIATSGDHGEQSVGDLSEQSPLVNMGPLALSTKVTLSTVELAVLLKQHSNLAKQASSLFRSMQDAMIQLVSADVIAPLQQRMAEFVDNVNHNLLVAHSDSPASSADLSAAVDAQKVLTNVLDGKSDATSTLGTLVSKCIDDCLVSVQKLRSLADLQALSTSATPFTGCYGESIQKYQARDSAQPITGAVSDAVEGSTASQQVILADCVTLSVSSLAACQLHKVTADIAQVQAYLNFKIDTMSAAEKTAASNVVRTLAPVLKLLRQAFTVLLDGLVLEYKSVGKLLYIVVRIFRTLLSKGICSSSVEEGEDDGSGDLSGMLFQDNIEGTGMGEGEGKKDVSDQIENEEQLLGLKDDVPKDPGEAKKPPEKKKLNEEEKDQGVEMTQDFEGEMFDIPSDDENDNNESEDEDGEEPEKEMGDANAEDIVDEKQWDDEDQDSDAGEDGNNKEQEKFEKDSKMQGEAIEGEMRTKDDDEGGDDKPEEDKDGDKNNAPEKSDDAEPDPQQGGAEPEENKINEDKEDGTMDKPLGVDVRKEEPEKPEPQPDNADDAPEEQMPEDGEAEGQDEKDAEGGDEGKPQEGDDNAGDDQDGKDGEGDDLPDDMNLDGDDQSEGAMDVDDEKDPEAPPVTEEPDESEEPHPDHNEAGKEGEEPEVDGNQLPVAGAGDLPDQDHENPEEEQEKKTEEEEEEPEDLPAEADADSSKPASFGVRNDQGQEALLNAADDEVVDANEDNRNASKEQQNQPPSALSAEQPQGKGGQSQGESKKGATHEVGGTHREDDGDQPPPVRKQEPPNPFKQAGNVNEKWHRRLNLVLPPDEGENDAGQEEDGMNDDNDSDVPDGGGKGLYEHASKEEGAMEQVLADAAEEDQVQLPESGEQKDSKQDAASAMEQDNVSPDDVAKEDPQEADRKRDRDEERYKGHKAKKKRLNDDAAPEPVEGELEAESEDDDSESDEELDEQANSGDEADSDAESDVPGNEDKSNDNKDIFDGSKVFTKEAFKFGATTDLQQAPEPEQTEDIMVNQTDNVVISANRLAKGRLVWQQHRMATESYSMRLCEQLRLILEPTLATRLRGDYRTGKRINMRKVIPYVASGFRKDKIWLRRTKPAKRAYQVMIMIDDSMSMGAAGPLALSSLATIANALTRLEIGELSITSFATDVNVLHKFGTPFTEEAGARVVSQFKFQASSTLLSASLAAVLPVFTQARTSAQNSAAGANAAVLQICFVISDARIDSDNREKLENTVRMLSEQHILVVLVIIDCNDDPKDSIFNTKSVSFVGNKVVTKSYFDDFPFPYYVALQKVEALPDVLSDALKQWFELVRLQTSN